MNGNPWKRRRSGCRQRPTSWELGRDSVARLRFSRSQESIPQSPLGADIARLIWVIAELVPQAAHIYAQVVDLVDILSPPHLRQERPVGQHIARVANEVVQQLVLGGRQIHSLA